MTARSRLAWAALSFALPTLACTFEDGRGFATLRSARLHVGFEPGSRQLDEELVTDLGYRVRIAEFDLEVDAVALEERVSAADATPTDLLCHGGHCHGEDDTHVDEHEVEADDAGTPARFVAVATFPVHRALDVLEHASVSLDVVEPSRELPRAAIRRVAVDVASLRLSGTVTGAALEADDVPFSIALAPGPHFDGATVLDVSHEGPTDLRLALSWIADGALLDGIDWAALAHAGTITIDDVDSAPAHAITTALAANAVELEIEGEHERSDDEHAH